MMNKVVAETDSGKWPPSVSVASADRKGDEINLKYERT